MPTVTPSTSLARAAPPQARSLAPLQRRNSPHLDASCRISWPHHRRVVDGQGAETGGGRQRCSKLVVGAALAGVARSTATATATTTTERKQQLNEAPRGEALLIQRISAHQSSLAAAVVVEDTGEGGGGWVRPRPPWPLCSALSPCRLTTCTAPLTCCRSRAPPIHPPALPLAHTPPPPPSCRSEQGDSDKQPGQDTGAVDQRSRRHRAPRGRHQGGTAPGALRRPDLFPRPRLPPAGRPAEPGASCAALR